MGRFKSIVGGPRQRRTITLPLPGSHYDPMTGDWDGPTDSLDIRSLRSDEYDSVIANAITFAKSKGVEKPQAGDELYERGLMLHTLLAACLDKDSPADAPVPYFESLEEIQTSEILLPETQQYLLQYQRMWQDEVSPLRMNLTEEEYIAGILRVVQGDVDFFLGLRLGMQWSFTRSMAKQLHDLMKQELSRTSQPSPQTPSEK